VPLSEHEQRVLEQIERALYADDPKFAAAVRGIDPRARQRRRYARAVAGAVLGLALLPVGIAVGHEEITFAGFLLALLAFLYGVTVWRRGPERARDARPLRVGGWRAFGRGHGVTRPRSAAGPKRGMMQRFEDRWNHRRDRYEGR